MRRQNVGFVMLLVGLAVVLGHLSLELSMSDPERTHPHTLWLLAGGLVIAMGIIVLGPPRQGMKARSYRWSGRSSDMKDHRVPPAPAGTGQRRMKRFMIIDPVCNMQVDEKPGLALSYENAVYYFCSEGCRAEFQRHPDDYAQKASAGNGVTENV